MGQTLHAMSNGLVSCVYMSCSASVRSLVIINSILCGSLLNLIILLRFVCLYNNKISTKLATPKMIIVTDDEGCVGYIIICVYMMYM